MLLMANEAELKQVGAVLAKSTSASVRVQGRFERTGCLTTHPRSIASYPLRSHNGA